MKTLLAAGALALVLAAPQATAGIGDPPLDPVLEAQLERWLGAGDQIFDNLYTRQPGDTSLDFHAAVDERGPTFTLMRVSDPLGNSYLIGGYNPQSWEFDTGWNVTERDFQRTAFLFNYTAPAVYRQVLTGFELPSQGSFQTYNAPNQGPSFGAGPDLFVNNRLDTAFSWRLSYGAPADEGLSIIDQSRGGQLFNIDAMELYAVSPIPEPAQAAMLAAGLGLVGVVLRRQRARSRTGRSGGDASGTAQA